MEEVEEMEEVEVENMDKVNCDEEDSGGDTVNFRRGGKSLMEQKMLMGMMQIETTTLNLQNPLKMQYLKQSLVRLKYRGSQGSIFFRSLKIRSLTSQKSC